MYTGVQLEVCVGCGMSVNMVLKRRNRQKKAAGGWPGSRPVSITRSYCCARILLPVLCLHAPGIQVGSRRATRQKVA